MSSLTKKIEDLEKKNQELCIDLGAYQNENENLVKDIEKYWKLEQELGCPLKVVFEMLENGITFENKGVKLRSDDIRLFYFNNKWIMRAYAFVQGWGSNAYDFELKDYGKRWWLKGEKNEYKV